MSRIHRTLRFNINGGVGITPADCDVTVDSEFSIPGLDCTRPYYGAVSWNTDSSHNLLTFVPGQITADEEFMDLLFSDSISTTLYVSWEKIRYTLTFDPNGCEGTVPDSISFEIDSRFTVPSSELSKKWYVMGQWNTAPDGTGLTIGIGDSVCTGNFIDIMFSDSDETVLYQQFSKDIYHINFDLNGIDDDAPGVIDISIGDIFRIPAYDYSRPHYLPYLWATSTGADGTVFDVGEVIADDNAMTSLFSDGGETTLYLIWEKVRYRFIFDSNGCRGSAPGPLDVTIGSSISVPSSSLTKRDYDILGWNTSRDGTGTDMSENVSDCTDEFLDSFFSSSSEITLYPKLALHDYTPEYRESSISCCIFIAIFLAVFYLAYRRF